MGESNWLVVRTKSKAEKKLALFLKSSGWEACCPTYTTLKQWSDRKKRVELPLISGVVFVKNTARPINDLYNYPQVVSILKEMGKPALVKSTELQNLLILCGQWEDDLILREQFTDFQPGDYVEVASGKFQGMRGELVKFQGKHKLYLLIKSLQMVFSIVLSKSQVNLISRSDEE
jgi:transcription antitermination factor NusG